MNGMTEGDERALAFCLFSSWLLDSMEKTPWVFEIDKHFEETIRLFTRSEEEMLSAKKCLPEQIREVFMWQFRHGRFGRSCIEYNPSKCVDWLELVEAYRKGKQKYGVNYSLFCEVWCNLPGMSFPVRPALDGWFSAVNFESQCAVRMYQRFHVKPLSEKCFRE